MNTNVSLEKIIFPQITDLLIKLLNTKSQIRCPSSRISMSYVRLLILPYSWPHLTLFPKDPHLQISSHWRLGLQDTDLGGNKDIPSVTHTYLYLLFTFPWLFLCILIILLFIWTYFCLRAFHSSWSNCLEIYSSTVHSLKLAHPRK